MQTRIKVFIIIVSLMLPIVSTINEISANEQDDAEENYSEWETYYRNTYSRFVEKGNKDLDKTQRLNLEYLDGLYTQLQNDMTKKLDLLMTFLSELNNIYNAFFEADTKYEQFYNQLLATDDYIQSSLNLGSMTFNDANFSMVNFIKQNKLTPFQYANGISSQIQFQFSKLNKDLDLNTIYSKLNLSDTTLSAFEGTKLKKDVNYTLFLSRNLWEIRFNHSPMTFRFAETDSLLLQFFDNVSFPFYIEFNQTYYSQFVEQLGNSLYNGLDRFYSGELANYTTIATTMYASMDNQTNIFFNESLAQQNSYYQDLAKLQSYSLEPYERANTFFRASVLFLGFAITMFSAGAESSEDILITETPDIPGTSPRKRSRSRGGFLFILGLLLAILGSVVFAMGIQVWLSVISIPAPPLLL